MIKLLKILLGVLVILMIGLMAFPALMVLPAIGLNAIMLLFGVSLGMNGSIMWIGILYLISFMISFVLGDE